ncbi:MAG: DegV family protein [Ruminococcus sp.]|nr:DegV family protein [Ruminococcus sp.]
MEYIFITDSSCDLNEKQVKEIGVEVIPMEFSMEDKSYLHYPDARLMSLDEFYSKLKTGVTVKTSQVNYNTFMNVFESYLKAGKDVIYTGISSGLSGTFNTCNMAVKDLKEKYPDRKIIVIDSICDSAGLGMLVYLAGKKYASGVSIEELADYINEMKTKLCHWFIVEDLDQLKRGGRISAVSATFGKALQIKPLIGVDETGGLYNAAKIRGKSNVIPTLLKHFENEATNPKENIVFVAHADNKQGALELQKELKGKCKEVQICDIGPVIGAHVGSGMLAILFVGNRVNIEN